MAALAQGQIAVVRPDPVTVDGQPAAVWWRIDRRTGNTIGVGPGGAGQTKTEYGAMVANMLLRVAGAAICVHKYIKAPSGSSGHLSKQEMGAIACFCGVLFSGLAKFAGSPFMPVAWRWSFAEATATDTL
jgi:hypothetical protein